MNAMTDETMALSVTEATMQDWLTAMALLREAPEPVAAPRDVLWPEDMQPVRRVAAATSRRRVAPAPASTDSAPLRVAGAGTVYWWLLALALAAALVV